MSAYTACEQLSMLDSNASMNKSQVLISIRIMQALFLAILLDSMHAAGW